MNVSEITLTRTTRDESDTDAYHILSNQFQLDLYISRFGNVEVVWDDEWTVYRVPSLDEKRNLYCEKKTRDCANGVVSNWHSICTTRLTQILGA